MKGTNFSCSSPASAAVCTSIERRSVVSPGSGRSTDHDTPHVKEPLRGSSLRHSSQQTTKSKSNNQKSMKSAETQLDLISYPSLRFRNRSGEKQPELIGPGNSSRCLLNDADGASFDVYPDQKSVPVIPPLERNESATTMTPSSSNVVQDQEVVLRVSLHCKGCEGKVRNHISKMEGVTSFSLDMATKKVVVIGKLTPTDVLNSVSKVKNAEFWSSTMYHPNHIKLTTDA